MKLIVLRQFSGQLAGVRTVSLAVASLALCAACGGSSFGSGGGAGATSGGSSSGGQGGGSTTGGSTSSAGTSSGGSSAAGSGVGGTATAGAAGSTSTGGAGASAGAGGAADCDTLKTEYAADVEKARGCDSGSTDECSTSSTVPTFGCGCPTLVNSKSEFTTAAKQKYQEIQDAKCPVGPVCNIACIAYTSVTCSVEMTSTGTAYQCTGTSGVIPN